jgi:hypothetical protein
VVGLRRTLKVDGPPKIAIVSVIKDDLRERAVCQREHRTRSPGVSATFKDVRVINN